MTMILGALSGITIGIGIILSVFAENKKIEGISLIAIGISLLVITLVTL